MKIITWNVNGLRALHGKNAISSVIALNPDVICLQEIKARPEQINNDLVDLPGYQGIWNPAERAGYSGVLTYTKLPPEWTKTGLGNPEFDIEGRVIWTKFHKTHLFNIYFPNGQRGQDRVDYKLRFYDQLLMICKNLMKSGEEIIITGDFNTAHTEIDLANPKENEKYSGFLPEEREKITEYLNSGFHDIFRILYPKKIQYSWWTYRFKARERGIGWRLDYYLITKGLIERVKDVSIFDDIQGSDHCPVMLELN